LSNWHGIRWAPITSLYWPQTINSSKSFVIRLKFPSFLKFV
jgi:hypothetical protein